MPVPKGWRRKRLVKSYRRACAPGSIRTVKSGKARVLVCCPKGKWKPRAARCTVGTRAISVDTPRGFGGLSGRRSPVTYSAAVSSGVIRLQAHHAPAVASKPVGREVPLRTVAEVRAFLREHAGYLGLTAAQKRRFREAVRLITADDLRAGRTIPFGGVKVNLAPFTVDTSEGDTYYRSKYRWAKVGHDSTGWFVAQGWKGRVRAEKVFRTGHRAPAGKGLAVQYARSWVEEE